MIVSKSNLLAVHATRADSNVPMLDNVMIAADGSSCGTSGRSVIVVSPVKEETLDKLKTILPNNCREDIIVSSDTVKEILKTMGSDRQYGGLLEHCNIEAVARHNAGDSGRAEVKVTLTDGKRAKTITGARYTRGYVPYQKIVTKAVDSAKKKSVRVVVNMKRLGHLLETIQKICPDGAGESPLFMEFGDAGEIIIRSINFVNGQRVIGIMSSYQGQEGKWLEYDAWEKQFLQLDKWDAHGLSTTVVKHKNNRKETSLEVKHKSGHC